MERPDNEMAILTCKVKKEELKPIGDYILYIEDRITALEAELKAAQDHAVTMEAKLKNSVPFEVFKYRCDKRFFLPSEPNYRCPNAPISFDCTADNCPLTKG